MIAVGKGLARDFSHATIDRFDLGPSTAAAANSFPIATEFSFKQAVDLLGLRAACARLDVISGLIQKSHTLVSSPRLHACKPAVDQAHGREPVQGRINPAIERNVGRTLIRWRMRSVAKELADRPPSFATKLGIVAPAVNVLRDEVAEYAADEHVRRKMLARFHARDAYQRSQAVRHDLGERAGILVGDYACHRPCGGGML